MESKALQRLSQILGADIPTKRSFSDVFDISKERADALLTGAVNRWQRQSSDVIVASYADAMREGFWHISTIKLAYVQGTGDFYLVNGRHRLKAVVEAGFPQEFMVEIHAAPEEAYVRNLVIAEDRGKRRAALDTAQISGLTAELGFEESNARDYKKYHAALNMILNAFKTVGSGMRQQMPQEVYDAAAKDWLPYWQEYSKIESAAQPGGLENAFTAVHKRMKSPAVAAVALVTLRSSKKDARDFWKEVAVARDSSPQTIKSLVNYFTGPDAQFRNPAAVSRVVARAWNGYIEDKPVGRLQSVEKVTFARGAKKLTVPVNTVPIFINGSPFDGLQDWYYTPFPGKEVHYRVGEPFTSLLDATTKWTRDFRKAEGRDLYAPEPPAIYGKLEERKVKVIAAKKPEGPKMSQPALKGMGGKSAGKKKAGAAK